MEEEKKQEQSFELRSEKVRSIVGQIPSSLVRYGITAIGVVLLCLFAVTYFLPYKQIYSGTATIHEISVPPTDSADATILLKFETSRPSNANGQFIYMQAPQGTLAGQIKELSPVRDTLERQEARCRFKSAEIKSIENQTVDFRIVWSSGNLLQKMLGGLSK